MVMHGADLRSGDDGGAVCVDAGVYVDRGDAHACLVFYIDRWHGR